MPEGWKYLRSDPSFSNHVRTILFMLCNAASVSQVGRYLMFRTFSMRATACCPNTGKADHTKVPHYEERVL